MIENRFFDLMEGKQSPLRLIPKRVAGQSAQEQLDKLRNEWFERGILITLLISLLLVEILRWFLKTPPNPLLVALVCLPICGYLACRMFWLLPHIKNLEQGIAGEKIIAEKLENLRASGYRVFHDLIGNNFNVDHVLVGPGGVFAIETKTWSRNKRDKITTDGKLLWKNGIKVDENNPIYQARAEAGWLHKLIKDITDENIFVQAVVLFPGWWIECKVPQPETLVLNPDQLAGYLKKCPIRLEEKNICFIANRLELLARHNNSILR